MGKYVRRIVLFLLVAVLLVALAVVYDRTHVDGWVGDYRVEVRVERTGPRPVRAASATMLFRWEWDWAGNDPARIDSPWKPVALEDDGSFTVEVRCFGKDSGLGRRLSFVRKEVLVLKVDYADGGSQLVAAELPDVHDRRPLVLQVP